MSVPKGTIERTNKVSGIVMVKHTFLFAYIFTLLKPSKEESKLILGCIQTRVGQQP